MLGGYAERFVTLPELGHPTASIEGDRVAFYANRTGQNEVYVCDLGTGEVSQWSDGGVPNHMQWPLAWAADGEAVYVHVDDTGDEANDVYALERDGTLRPIVETAGQTNLHDVGADGETLLVSSTHERQMNLYRADPDGGELSRLTDHASAVWEATLSPDGMRVAYATNGTDDAHNRAVYVVGIDGSGGRQLDLGVTGSETLPVDWDPAGDRLLVADDTPGTDRPGVYDFRDGTVRWYGDGQFVETPAFFMPDGKRLLAERTRDATVTPVVYESETGESHSLALTDGVADFGWRSNRVVDANRVLVTYTTPTRRPALVVYDLANDTHDAPIERDSGGIDPDEFVDAAYLRVESNGVPDTRQAAVEHEPCETLEIGALLYDPGTRPAPLVVNPHGGPNRMDRRAFDRRAQFLLALGYAVLQVNYRGSAGRGRAFADALVGDWGGAEQGDIATVVEHVVETREWIDPTRVGVYGGSYGGYSAYWQLFQYPDLYAAGVGVVGLTDLLDAYEQAPPNFRTEYFERYLGSPAENGALYRERSPVTHADNLRSPVLVTHGVSDPRVPVSQARRLRDALLAAGKERGEDGDFEYHELTERGHGTVDVDQRLRTARLFADFLERRL